MRKKAPLMFAFGALMVLVQWLAAVGLLIGMIFPSCGTNDQCHAGTYCHVAPDRTAGRCLYCGEGAPLVPYESEEPWPDDFDGPKPGRFKVFNYLQTGSYNKVNSAGTRGSDPSGFAGYNLTQVTSTCTPPYQPFRFAVSVRVENEDTDDEKEIVTVTDGHSIPAGIHPSKPDGLKPLDFTHDSVRNWCLQCVTFAGNAPLAQDSVSINNGKLLAEINGGALAVLDWFALVLCSYFVGLTMAGEVKDMALVDMAAQRGIEQLGTGWRIAVAAVGRFRVHFLLQPLMSAIPVIILSQGGGALDTCFNTVAVLFLTEVDNLSFQFALSERDRQRVHARGHIMLSKSEAAQIAFSKKVCIAYTVLCTTGFVWNKSLPGAMFSGAYAGVVFKLSELAEKRKSMSPKEIALFIAVSIVSAIAAFAVYMTIFFPTYSARF